MTGRRWWLAGTALAVLAAAACGGAGDNKSKSSTGETSRSSLGQQAATTAVAPQAAARTDSAGSAGAAPGDAKAAPAQGGQPQGGQASSGQPVPSLDRKIIYNVTLDLTVDDVQAVSQTVSSIALTNGGYIAETDVRQDTKDAKDRRAMVTIRVPVDRFAAVMSQIRGLGKLDAERSSASDVTEEYTDLQSRIRTLEATEAKLLEFLAQAKSIQDTLTVQDRINAVRTEIDRARGRMNLLTKLSDLATIRVQLKPEAAPAVREPPKADSGPLAALRRGWEASTDLLGGVTTVLLTAVAFSWWLLPPAALGAWLVRRERRNRLAATRHVPPAAGGTP